MLKLKSIALGCLITVAVFDMQAQAYDLANGRLLSSNCTQCHATNAMPKSSGYDSLVGMSYSSIYGELRDMASKFNATTKTCTESDPKDCLMAVHAKPYTDQELQDIAGYLSQR